MVQDLGPYRSAELAPPKRPGFWAWLSGLFRPRPVEPRVWSTPREYGGIWLHLRAPSADFAIELDERDLERLGRKICQHDGRVDMPVRGRDGAIFVVPACLASATIELVVACAKALERP